MGGAISVVAVASPCRVYRAVWAVFGSVAKDVVTEAEARCALARCEVGRYSGCIWNFSCKA